MGKPGKIIALVSDLMVSENEQTRVALDLVRDKVRALDPEFAIPEDREELLILFRYFEKKLEYHFNLEESFGIHREMEGVAPELDSQVRLLNAEHVDLLRELRAVFQHLESQSRWESSVLTHVREKFETFLQTLKNHDAREIAAAKNAAYSEEE